MSTDKHSHGYLEFYEPFFKKMENCKNVMEIGVRSGDSLILLSTYFPKATIHGIDIVHRNYNFPYSDKIKTYTCDQENRDNLEKLVNTINQEFDIILDDGGHTMKQQQTSFGFLFNRIKKGGVYIIEDLHTSKDNDFRHPDDLITSLDMLENFQKTNKLVSNYITDTEKEYIENNIESILLWSRTPSYNESATSAIFKK